MLLLCAVIWEMALRGMEGRLRHCDKANFPGTMGEKIFYLRELQKAGNVPDTLLVGDSSVAAGLSPDIFERALDNRVNAVNLGEAMYPEILPGFAHYLTNDLRLSPRRVVVEYNWPVMNEYCSQHRYYAGTLQFYAGIRMIQGTETFLDSFALWRDRKVPLQLATIGPPYFESASWLKDRGWVAHDWRLDERSEKDRHSLDELVEGYLRDFQIRPTTVESLRKGLLEFKKIGADVTFVLPPTCHGSGAFRSRVEKALSETRQKVFPMVRECGVRLLDCSIPPFPENECFLDPVHLNRKGATLYTQWLAAQLSKEWR
jgi:hypothetical protein